MYEKREKEKLGLNVKAPGPSADGLPDCLHFRARGRKGQCTGGFPNDTLLGGFATAFSQPITRVAATGNPGFSPALRTCIVVCLLRVF